MIISLGREINRMFSHLCAQTGKLIVFTLYKFKRLNKLTMNTVTVKIKLLLSFPGHKQTYNFHQQSSPRPRMGHSATDTARYRPTSRQCNRVRLD